MGIQDRDYWREWWANRDAPQKSEEHEDELPVQKQKRRPLPFWSWAAWVVIACCWLYMLVYILRAHSR